MFDLLGSIGSSALSFLGGERRNEAQAEQAEDMMRFQAMMSNTAYTRAVKDLKNAGLNPMLAYQHGGASTPAGAMAQIEDTLTPAINSGKETYRAVNQAQVQKAQVHDIEASAGLKTQQTSESAAKTEEAHSQAALNAELAAKASQDTMTSAASSRLMDTQGSHILASIEKIAPEIKEIVSRTNLNDAQRAKALQELPLVVANISRTKAETTERYQHKILLGVETYLKSLSTNESTAMSEFWGSKYGKTMPYVHSGAKALGEVTGSLSPWAWLLKSPVKSKGK